MGNQSPATVFSPKRSGLWRNVEPGIWTTDSDDRRDQALAMIRTLLDQPRWLEPYHLYDERGSQLFDRICELPEYYPTRTENSILTENAAAIIRSARPDCIVELG
ncbi:MAG TPA: L-histidine N(alpha)-methyltransferase, partial [Candidatus Binatia bacterium]